MTVKHYTLAEANLLLPIVDQELRKLQELKRQFAEKYLDLRRKKTGLSELQSKSGEDPFFTEETELEFLQIEANSHMASFQLKGIELKDIDMGLVDFPAMVGGEEVLLCWRQGEATIGYYHSRTDGFAGRRAIEE